jgi:hypothetical protein
LSSFFFRLTLALSAGLILLVLLAPLGDNGRADGPGWQRLAALFARDPAVRRTAIASAIGLAVTGCIFFRVPPPGRPSPRAPRQPRPPQSPPVVGA